MSPRPFFIYLIQMVLDILTQSVSGVETKALFLVLAVIRGRTYKKTSNGKLMDICGLIVFIYFCSGRGQPHGADKQMRLDGRCCPGSVTDRCLSVYCSCLTARPVVRVCFFELPCWRCLEW